MHKPFLKAIALTGIISIGALAAAPRAEAHDNDFPAAIAGIALGAIIASQASRHRRHYDYYEPAPYAYYAPPPYYYQERKRHRKYAKPVKRHRKKHSTPSYYPSKRHHYNGGRRVAPLPDLPDYDREGRDP